MSAPFKDTPYGSSPLKVCNVVHHHLHPRDSCFYESLRYFVTIKAERDGQIPDSRLDRNERNVIHSTGTGRGEKMMWWMLSQVVRCDGNRNDLARIYAVRFTGKFAKTRIAITLTAKKR